MIQLLFPDPNLIGEKGTAIKAVSFYWQKLSVSSAVMIVNPLLLSPNANECL